MMRFWLDKGVDGFRMDVINIISKPWSPDGRLLDAPVTQPGFLQPAFGVTTNGPRLMEYLLEMKREVLSKYDCITVGETPGGTTDVARRITDRRHGALNMMFQFEHMDLDAEAGKGKWAIKPFDLRDLKLTMTRWQEELTDCGWNSLYLCNHDQPRSVSRFADDGRYRVESAKMLATFLHCLQGTPFVYQGEELGMTNYPFAWIDECRDIETLNMYREAVIDGGLDPSTVMRSVRAKGRDNARTPMQWSAQYQAGFTSGVPWLPVHPNHVTVNAEASVADPDSIFHHYRRLIALRRELPVMVHGRYELLLAEHPKVFAYTRTLGSDRLLVLCNFSAETIEVHLTSEVRFDGCELLLSNWMDSPRELNSPTRLRPYEALLYRLSLPGLVPN